MKWVTLIFKVGNDVQQKGWYASKTVWFNILTLAGMAAALKGFNLSADDILAVAAGASSLGNILLRATTRTPLGVKTVPATVQPAAVAEVRPEPATEADRDFDGGSIMG